jgi:putative glutathione S-transferase
MGLENIISVTMVKPEWGVVNKEGRRGWVFDTSCKSKVLKGLKCEDPIFGCKNLYDVYRKASSGYTDKVTVPLLLDKKTKKIVNNESTEIVRMFNDQFKTLLPLDVAMNAPNLYPKKLQKKIAKMHEWIYDEILNGVYKTGFATTQVAYDEAFKKLFKGLDKCEKILQQQDFLLSNDDPCYVDLRLYQCLIRFDAVYVVHFKCNKRTIESYPALSAWVRRMFHDKGMYVTTDI